MKKKKFSRSLLGILVLVAVGLSGKGYFQNNSTQEHDFQIKSSVQVGNKADSESKEFLGIRYDPNKYPNNIVNINDGKYTLTKEDHEALSEKGSQTFWVNYADLDQLGRAGDVEALITYDAINSHSSKNVERPSFKSSVHIAGEYKDRVFDQERDTWVGKDSNNEITQLEGYKGYLYNKSHSLAWSLGGDMEVHNLTLGTRAQNVGKNDQNGGMAYSETIVRDAIYKNKNEKVLYKVDPIYKGNELVPRGSHVEAFSVNDNGKTVNLNVYVFNNQKGININYQNGTWVRD
ncbi:DNA/RNA non-specific endonuclease [Enterococcus faecium]|nr:DNA/RNA non-specific endonuclease [Enterococcus faecium]